MSHDYEGLVLDYFRAVDEERLDDVVSCFAGDGSIQFPFKELPVVGHEDLRAFLAEHVGRFARDVIACRG